MSNAAYIRIVTWRGKLNASNIHTRVREEIMFINCKGSEQILERVGR